MVAIYHIRRLTVCLTQRRCHMYSLVFLTLLFSPYSAWWPSFFSLMETSEFPSCGLWMCWCFCLNCFEILLHITDATHHLSLSSVSPSKGDSYDQHPHHSIHSTFSIWSDLVYWLMCLFSASPHKNIHFQREGTLPILFSALSLACRAACSIFMSW